MKNLFDFVRVIPWETNHTLPLNREMNPNLDLFYMSLELLQLNTCSQKEKFKVIKTIWAF